VQVKKDEIIALLGARKSGQRGWLTCSYECPYCKRPDHLSIIFGEKVSSFRCVKCSEHGSMFILLSKIKRLDLLLSKVYDKELTLVNKLSPKLTETELLIEDLPTLPPPIGFKRIYEDLYLEGRGFTKEQFNLFKVGVTKIDPKLKKDYLIFLIEEKGKNVGYLARSRKTKKEIQNINLAFKEKGLKNKYLRWCNSSSDFEKIVFGLEECTPNTKTLILVEGATSKFNVDRELKLYTQEEVKCGVTFGKKVSPYQIQKIFNKGIENIILLHDPDAIKESKEYSLELDKYFNTLVGFIPFKGEEGDKDPGDMTSEEICYVLETLEKPLDFNKNKLAKKELK